MELKSALVVVIVFLAGLGIGAYFLYLFFQHTARQLGFAVEDAKCVECGNPVTYMNGQAILHWSHGGYVFCSDACVNKHHTQKLALLREGLGLVEGE